MVMRQASRMTEASFIVSQVFGVAFYNTSRVGVCLLQLITEFLPSCSSPAALTSLSSFLQASFLSVDDDAVRELGSEKSFDPEVICY